MRLAFHTPRVTMQCGCAGIKLPSRHQWRASASNSARNRRPCWTCWASSKRTRKPFLTCMDYSRVRSTCCVVISHVRSRSCFVACHQRTWKSSRLSASTCSRQGSGGCSPAYDAPAKPASQCWHVRAPCRRWDTRCTQKRAPWSRSRRLMSRVGSDMVRRSHGVAVRVAFVVRCVRLYPLV